MAKQASQIVKLQIKAGMANPAPPIGTVLGPTGVNIGDFCSQFNAATKERMGEIVPAVLSIYPDRSFDFILKTPPASFLLRKAAGIEKGSGKCLIKRAGSVTKGDVAAIAKQKLEDLNARTLEAAEEIVRGTAKSMGIEVKG